MSGPKLKSAGTSRQSQRATAQTINPASAALEATDAAMNKKLEGNSAVMAMAAYYVRARAAFRKFGLNWPIVIWIGLVHFLAILAPFFFSWPALVTCVALAFITGSFGVCMGYHRL